MERQDRGQEGQTRNNHTLLGISPLPQQEPWPGAARAGAIEEERERWLRDVSGAWGVGPFTAEVRGTWVLALPFPASGALEHQRGLSPL